MEPRPDEWMSTDETGNREKNIHSEPYVKALFNEMSQTYGVVNILSSLGFAYIWRKQAIDSIPRDCRKIADLMCGGGESLSHVRACRTNSLPTECKGVQAC